jgi:hypothetical protein
VGALSRRELLARAGAGLGGLALSWLLRGTPARAAAPARVYDTVPKPPHFAAKARNVILLFMGGGPSHMDLFDPKPLLAKMDGQTIPFGVEQRGLNNGAKIMGSPFRFARHGQCGHEISELLPHLAGVADDLAIVRSGVSTRIDHGEAELLLHTGRPIRGFPSMGSWITYGLGAENANLPAYIALGGKSPNDRVLPITSAGCLPSLYQGTPMNTDGAAPFYYLAPPAGAAPSADFLRLTQAYNRRHREGRAEVTQLDARIQNYELAARMQVEAMRQLDLAGESDATRRLYGLDDPVTEDFGRRCLLARRLVESGVRFVHVVRFDWDHHAALKKGLTKSCAETDRPVAGLLRDLKSRGLLDSTLVVWTGEFGRLPVAEGADGRDHNPYGYSFWLAGGGVKAGTLLGATDEFGYKAISNPVRTADLHATLLHLLGLHHDRLAFDFEGREETLTGVEPARVVRELVA